MFAKNVVYAVESLLQSITATNAIWVAFSGGVDSLVLLHALAKQKTKHTIKAVHINHGLNPKAMLWELHCQQLCNDLGIQCEVIRVDANPKSGESIEAYARELRYKAFSHLLADNEHLVSAHHLDDQAETLLLQLFRGSGVDGLASMPKYTRFAKGFLVRPFLEISREEIIKYAKSNALHWIEDDSNANIKFDRNFLRNAILPFIRERWPSTSKSLARSARHCASAASILREVAHSDLLQVQRETNSVSITGLLKLSRERRNNLLRYWLQTLDLPIPTEKLLHHLLNDVVNCSEDAMPLVAWEGAEIRRFRDEIFAMTPLQEHDATQIMSWDLLHDLILPSNLGSLRSVQVLGRGIHAAMLNVERNISVRFRHGGEVMHPNGRVGTHPLKKLFQEWQVPPWLRDRVPLIYIDDELVAVVGYAVAQRYHASRHELGWLVELI